MCFLYVHYVFLLGLYYVFSLCIMYFYAPFISARSVLCFLYVHYAFLLGLHYVFSLCTLYISIPEVTDDFQLISPNELVSIYQANLRS